MKIHIHTSYHSKPVKHKKEEILNTAQVFILHAITMNWKH